MEDRDILGNWEDHLLNTYLDSLDDTCEWCKGEGVYDNSVNGEDMRQCPCQEDYEPDPDTMLGGHDNPHDAPWNQDEGEDCFERALWNANPPPAPFDREDYR